MEEGSTGGEILEGASDKVLKRADVEVHRNKHMKEWGDLGGEVEGGAGHRRHPIPDTRRLRR